MKVFSDINEVEMKITPKEYDNLEKIHAFKACYRPDCPTILFWCKHIDLNSFCFVCLSRAKGQTVAFELVQMRSIDPMEITRILKKC